MKRYAKCTALLLSVLLILSVLSACGGSGSRTPTLNELNKSTGSAKSTTGVMPSAASTTSAAASGSNGSASDFTNFSYSTYLTEDGHFEGVTALDCVTLPAYEGITVPADVHTITDEAVQEQIDALRDSYKTYEQITDRKLENGDTVNIDYVGTIDGVAFEGGSTGGAGTLVTWSGASGVPYT